VSTNSILFITALVGRPLLTTIHELGHAAMALRETSGVVVIRVGRNRPSVALKVIPRRLVVLFSPLGARGWTRLGSPPTDRRRWVKVALAGPVADLIAAALLGLVGAASAGQARTVCLALCGLSFVDGVGNLVPRWGAEQPSDGLLIRCLIRGERLGKPPPRRRSGLRDPVDTGTLIVVTGVVLFLTLVKAHVVSVAVRNGAACLIAGLVVQALLDRPTAPKSEPSSPASPQVAPVPSPALSASQEWRSGWHAAPGNDGGQP
jgi:hypothetical protein